MTAATTLIKNYSIRPRPATARARPLVASLVGGALATALLLEPSQVTFVPAGAVEACYVALAGVSACALLLGRRLTRVEVASLGLVVIVSLYGAMTSGPLVAALGTIWILKPVLAFLAGMLLAGQRTEETVARVALAGSLLVSGSVLAEALGWGWLRTSQGTSGIYGGAAQAAHAGVLGLLLVQGRWKRGRRLTWAAASLFVVSIVLTQSRHGLLLGCLAVVPVAGLATLWRVRWIARLTVALVVVGVAIVTLGEQTVARFAEVREIASGRDYYRLHALQVALEAGGENAGLGVGPGRFGGPVAHRFVREGGYQRDLLSFWQRRGTLSHPTTTDLAAAHVIGELGYLGFLILYGWGAWLLLDRRRRGVPEAIGAPRALVVVAAASLFTFAPITNGPLQLVLFMVGTRRRPDV